MNARLPAHLEAMAMIRTVQAAGGFAAVLHKGERDAGTLLVVLARSDGSSMLYERMPQPDGTRVWTLTRNQDSEKQREFSEYLDRRVRQDSDIWVLELTTDDGERLVLQS